MALLGPALQWRGTCTVRLRGETQHGLSLDGRVNNRVLITSALSNGRCLVDLRSWERWKSRHILHRLSLGNKSGVRKLGNISVQQSETEQAWPKIGLMRRSI